MITAREARKERLSITQEANDFIDHKICPVIQVRMYTDSDAVIRIKKDTDLINEVIKILKENGYTAEVTSNFAPTERQLRISWA